MGKGSAYQLSVESEMLTSPFMSILLWKFFGEEEGVDFMVERRTVGKLGLTCPMQAT